MRHTMTRFRIFLETLSLVLVIAVCAAMLYVITNTERLPAPHPVMRAGVGQRSNAPIPIEPATLDGAQIEGNRAAKVAVIEYSDFQCPYCGRFANETFPQFEREYVHSGKVLFAFREFPLESIHPYAMKAAEVAECAADQGRFWRMQALTFADQAHLDDTALRERAAKAAMDLERFDKCMKGDVASRVHADEEAGKGMLVAGTPTFFVGTVQADGRVKIVTRLSGAVPFDRFKATIEAVMSAPTVARRSN